MIASQEIETDNDEHTDEYRIIVTGSREWTDESIAASALLSTGAIATAPEKITIVHGDNPRGLDRMAARIATAAGMRVLPYRADWRTFGNAAGLMRNAEMVLDGAFACFAFPLASSKGTRHCMAVAEEAGIPVINFGDIPMFCVSESAAECLAADLRKVGMIAEADDTTTNVAWDNTREQPMMVGSVAAERGYSRDAMSYGALIERSGFRVFRLENRAWRIRIDGYTGDRCDVPSFPTARICEYVNGCSEGFVSRVVEANRWLLGCEGTPYGY